MAEMSLPSETTPAPATVGLPSTTAPTMPAPGQPGYEAAMAAKYDSHQAGQGAAPGSDVPPPAVKPEGVPEKFWDAEKGVVRTDDLLKSYQELEKNRGVPPVAPPVVPPLADGLKVPDGAADAAATLASKGLDMSTFSTEFQSKGELSAESFTALEAAGIPKPMVEAYIEGQRAVAAQRDSAGYELAGGKDAFAKMSAWAAQAMPVDERVALNEQFSGSEAAMRLAVTSLRAKYEAANGREPVLTGGNPAGASSSGYESRAQMTSDMKDPRYSNDPAYRAKVSEKLSRTTAF